MEKQLTFSKKGEKYSERNFLYAASNEEKNVLLLLLRRKIDTAPKTRTIKRGDPDYKRHSYVGNGKRLIGDIKLTEYDFKCISCDKLIPYDEQSVIEEVQKYVGTHTLSQDDINENSEKAKAALEKKRKIKTAVIRAIGAAVVVLAICYWLKSGNFPFNKIYF